MNSTITAIVSILTAVVGLAIVAVLVSRRADTSNVIQSFFGGYAQIITAAVSPLTGGGGGGLSIPEIPSMGR